MTVGPLQSIPMPTPRHDYLDPRTVNRLAGHAGLRSSIRWARMPVGLWHYTCDDHGRPGIDTDGFLRPAWEWLTPASLDHLDPDLKRVAQYASSVVWMTDLPNVTARDAETVGLAQAAADSCNRIAHRYRVDPETPAGHILAFREYVAAGAVPPDVVTDLTAFPVDPDRWFVSLHRVRVIKADR